jgi:hypothetical protein
VLEWGYDGKRWTAAPWWGCETPEPRYERGRPISVMERNQLRGLLLWEYGNWKIYMKNLSTGEESFFSPSVYLMGPRNVAPFATLEGYNLRSPQDAPGNIEFKSIKIKDEKKKWNPPSLKWKKFVNPKAKQILPRLNVEISFNPDRISHKVRIFTK